MNRDLAEKVFLATVVVTSWTAAAFLFRKGRKVAKQQNK